METAEGLRRGAPVEHDSRGILAPRLLLERTDFSRYEPDAPLAGLVDWFWAARWDLPPGLTHRQRIVQHPAVNLSVATPDARTGRHGPEARLTGTVTGLADRELGGRGWVVALKTTVGGAAAFVPGPVSALVGRVVEVDVVPGLHGPTLVRDVVEAGDEPARVRVLARAVEGALDRSDPARVAAAREVAAIARCAETDRSVRRLDDLAARAGSSPRALQRMFLRHAGVSPTWVLRRYRLLDAAEAVRHGERVVWADIAHALGYSDQAHLVRDFRGVVGETPEAYARSLRPPPALRSPDVERGG